MTIDFAQLVALLPQLGMAGVMCVGIITIARRYAAREQRMDDLVDRYAARDERIMSAMYGQPHEDTKGSGERKDGRP